MFAVQNQLLFVAVRNLDPPVFQALSQLKILWAGVFSVVLLGRQLTAVQWTALVILACGAALVQLESSICREQTAAHKHGDPVMGFVVVLVACVISGLAGCYTELMLKTEKLPMWLQSAQVAMASAAILVFIVTCQRTSTVWLGSHAGIGELGGEQFDVSQLLHGFTTLTWMLVLTISLGGLTVVAVLRVADNVLKGMAMVFSLLLSGTASQILFEAPIGPVFCIAGLIICCSVFLYQHKPPADVKDQKELLKNGSAASA